MQTGTSASSSPPPSRPHPLTRHVLGALGALAVLSGCNAIPDAELGGSGRATPESLTTGEQGLDYTYPITVPPPPYPAPSTPTAAQMEPCVSAINAKYTALGGAASVLGSATTAVLGYFSTPGAVQCYRTFTGGSIEWSAATGAHEVHGDIGRKWAHLGHDMSFLALPTTDELVGPNSGRYNDFQFGAIYWHPTLGAYAMRAEIHAKYKAVGGAGSRLGYPTNDTTVLDYNPGLFNHFQGGSIYYSTATGARAVHGPTRDRWAADGWERGYLGYPSSDTHDGLVRGGSFTHFQGWDRRHSIYSSSAGTRVVSGRIREKWASLGWERSALGYPFTDTADYTTYGSQTFEGGYIFFSNATGVHEVHGSIGRRYWETGSPEGTGGIPRTYLGYPTSDEIGGLPACRASGCGLGAKSVFEAGSIYWSPVNGAHDMPRAIEQRLEALGGLTGCLGYPVSNWDSATGTVRFEGGTLSWRPGWASVTGGCTYGGSGGGGGGMTPVCGGASQACCAGNTCYGQTDCEYGTCRQRSTCTSSSQCFGGNCLGGYCVPCGDTNESCCWGSVTTEVSCQPGNQCSGNTCTRCGHRGEVCCTNSNLGGLGGQSCLEGTCNGYSCQ